MYLFSKIHKWKYGIYRKCIDFIIVIVTMTILWPSLYHLNCMHAYMHAFTHSYIGIQKTLPKHLCAQNFHSLETWEQSGSRFSPGILLQLWAVIGVYQTQNSSTSSVPRLKHLLRDLMISHVYPNPRLLSYLETFKG